MANGIDRMFEPPDDEDTDNDPQAITPADVEAASEELVNSLHAIGIPKKLGPMLLTYTMLGTAVANFKYNMTGENVQARFMALVQEMWDTTKGRQ